MAAVKLRVQVAAAEEAAGAGEGKTGSLAKQMKKTEADRDGLRCVCVHVAGWRMFNMALDWEVWKSSCYGSVAPGCCCSVHHTCPSMRFACCRRSLEQRSAALAGMQRDAEVLASKLEALRPTDPAVAALQAEFEAAGRALGVAESHSAAQQALVQEHGGEVEKTQVGGAGAVCTGAARSRISMQHRAF